MSLNRIERRERIKMRIRKIVCGTAAQPRMTVFRSNKQIYVQFIDDLAGATLATASSLDKEVVEAVAGKNKSDVAALVGKLAAARATAKGIAIVSFDRNGYLYHGRVKQLADAAREGGLKF
ncbi:MAG: 50S ribosomal protein L18 [Alistipes sp.]